MTLPLLTLLAAGSFQGSPERPAFEVVAFEIAVTAIQAQPLAPDLEPGVVDVPYYYDRLMPAAVPAAPLLVTYDWRSPVVFDLP